MYTSIEYAWRSTEYLFYIRFVIIYCSAEWLGLSIVICTERCSCVQHVKVPGTLLAWQSTRVLLRLRGGFYFQLGYILVTMLITVGSAVTQHAASLPSLAWPVRRWKELSAFMCDLIFKHLQASSSIFKHCSTSIFLCAGLFNLILVDSSVL